MKSLEELENTSKLNDLHEFDISEESREVYLCGEIDEKNTGKLIKNINYLNSISSDPIVLHCCSPGGETLLGFGLCSIIRLSKSPIVFVGHGQVCSMAAIIMQSATVRLITPLTYIMVHDGDITVEDDKKKVYAWIKVCKNQIDEIYSMYADRCKVGIFFSGKSHTVIKNFLKKKITKLSDWYLNGDDAIKYGFIDGFLGSDLYPSLESVISSFEEKKEIPTESVYNPLVSADIKSN